MVVKQVLALYLDYSSRPPVLAELDLHAALDWVPGPERACASKTRVWL